MKHDKHPSSGRGGDSKRSKGKDAHGKPQHGESAKQGYHGEGGYYPPMESAYHPEQQPYPHQYTGYYQHEHQHQHQQGYYSHSAPPASSASAGPSLSAILNHGDPADDYPRHVNTNTYPSANIPVPATDSRIGSSGSMGSSGALSKMALHNALSPVVPSTPSTTASGPVASSLASVVLSDQRSVTSASDVTYTSHTQTHPQTYRTHDGHPMYASAEDFQKGKANLDYHYYHSNNSNNSNNRDAYEHEHEQEQYTTLSRGTEAERRTSGSSRSSKHHNAAASYTSEPPSRGLPPAARRDTGKKPSKSGSLSKGRKEDQKSQKSQTGPKGQKGQDTSGHYHNSHLYAAPPSSSTDISSPAFSAPDTPGQQTPRLVSAGNRSFGSSEGEGEYYDQDQDDDDNASSYGARARDRDASSAPSVQQPPAVQRERNRVAATKCRAKSKAAISKLEEEERLMSDQRQSLVAQKSALVDEMLNLREQLLLHGSCESGGGFIKQYITNAAHTIADSGGKRLIWGSDGTGKAWGDERHGHGHGHEHGHDQNNDNHDHTHDGHGKGHAKKEKKRK